MRQGKGSVGQQESIRIFSIVGSAMGEGKCMDKTNQVSTFHLSNSVFPVFSNPATTVSLARTLGSEASLLVSMMAPSISICMHLKTEFKLLIHQVIISLLGACFKREVLSSTATKQVAIPS